MEKYAKDLENTLNDARRVKEDLDFLLDNAVKISEKINSELEEKIRYKEEFISKQEKIESGYEIERKEVIDNKAERIRVYQAAQYLGMDSRRLLGILKEMGYEVTSQLNMIDAGVLNEIKEFMAGKGTLDGRGAEETGNRYDLPDKKDDILNELKNAHPYIAVRVLHERGYTIKEIAKFLGRGQGEVQILLNLAYKNKAI